MRKSISANLSDTIAHLEKASANYTRQRLGTKTVERIAARVIDEIERANRAEVA